MSSRLLFFPAALLLFCCRHPQTEPLPVPASASERFLSELKAAVNSVDSARLKSFISAYNQGGQSDSELAEVCHQFGNTLYSENKNEIARLCFHEALRLRLQYYNGEHRRKDVLRAYCLIGATYNEQQDFHTALNYLDSANVWLPEAAVKPYIFVLLNTGQAYLGINELAQAQMKFRAAYDSMALYRNSVPKDWRVKLLNLYASSSRKIGQDSLALCLSAEGVTLPGLSLVWKADFEALWANILIDSLQQCKSMPARKTIIEQSKIHVRKAMGLYKEIHNLEGIVRTATNFGELYRRVGESDMTVMLLSSVLNDTATVSLDQDLLSPLHINLGEAYFDQNRPELALTEYDAALTSMHPKYKNSLSLDKLLPVHQPNFLYTLGNIAKTHLYRYSNLQKADGLDKAEMAYNSMAQLAKLMRSELVTEEAKFALAEKTQDALVNAVGICRQLYQVTGQENYKERAFVFSDQSKAFALIEAVRLRSMGIALPDQQKRKEIALREMSFDTLKDLLAANQGLLSYFMEDNTLHIFLLKKETLSWEKVNVDKIRLLEISDHFRELIQLPAEGSELDAKDQELGELGNVLYRLLIEPMKKHTLPDRLIIVPASPFQGIPFEALSPHPYFGSLEMQINKENFLLFDNSISYATSANLWGEMTQKKPANLPKKKVAAFAPRFNADLLPHLPNNQKEIDTIATVASNKVDIQKLGTKSAFLEAARRYEILHISTHGVANDQDNNLSYIAFEQQNSTIDESQLLYLRELYVDTLPQQLIVLSACETNVGKYVTGEGNLSIARGLTYAGAQSFITTLWPIKTNPGLTLMPDLYKELLVNGTAKDQALCNAKRRYIKNKVVPISDWAGFVLNGSTRPLSSSNYSTGLQLIFWCLLGVLLLLVSAWYFRNRRKAIGH